MRPPRALAVPFELGRPLGVPGDAPSQKAVLRAALSLFSREDRGPILEFYDAEVPSSSTAGEGWSCPVSFAAGGSEGSIADEVASEMGLLRPWYEKGLEERGRTTVGLSGLTLDAIPEFLARFLDSPGAEAVASKVSLGAMLKAAAEDLKAFYNEAATAQPGNATAREIERWYWNDCRAGAMIREIAAKGREHPDREVQIVAAFTLVPTSQARRDRQVEAQDRDR